MVAMLAACTLSLHARIAWGAPFELEWSAPAGCPTRERILAASRQSLGEGESSAPPELFVHGTVVVEDAALVVHLRVTDAAGRDLGERRVRFDDRRCEAIEEPTALLLAMMIAVAHSREPAPPASGPSPELASKPSSAQGGGAPTPPLPPTKRERSRPPMTLGASAVASLGLLPHVGLGGALRWTVTLAPVVLGIEGSFETSWAAQAASGKATFRFFDVGALAGVSVVRTRSLEIIPLVELRGGLLAGSATGFPSSEDATRIVGIVAAGALGRLRLGPQLYLEAMPDVRVPLAHDEFAVREGGELIRVHSTAPVEARLAVGLGWSFR